MKPRNSQAIPSVWTTSKAVREPQSGVVTPDLLETVPPRGARPGAGGWMWGALATLIGLPLAHARRLERPAAVPESLSTVLIRPKAKPGAYVLDASRTLTASRLREALWELHAAKKERFKPMLSLDAGVPPERLLEALNVVGEAGIPEAFYTVAWSNSPSRFGGFSATLATRDPGPTDAGWVMVLSIQEDAEEYTVDGEPVRSPLAEASWRLEAALRKQLETRADPTMLRIEVGPGINTDRLNQVMIGAQHIGFLQRRLSGRSPAAKAP